MVPKMLYNDRAKYLIKNYKGGASQIAPDLMFASGHNIGLQVSRQSTCNRVDKRGCHLQLHICVKMGLLTHPDSKKGKRKLCGY